MYGIMRGIGWRKVTLELDSLFLELGAHFELLSAMAVMVYLLYG